MFGWTLLDTILGGEALEMLGGIDLSSPAEDEDGAEGEVVLPDYAESLQAHRRIHGVV